MQQLKDQNIQRQKISVRKSYNFTFFVLVVGTVECLFFSWVEDLPIAERFLTIWNDITKLVKYWKVLLEAKWPSLKSYVNVKMAVADDLMAAKLKCFCFKWFPVCAMILLES